MNHIPTIGSGSFDDPGGEFDETVTALRGALHREGERVVPSRDGLQRIQRQLHTDHAARRPGPFLGRLTPALTAAAAVAVLAVAGAVAVRLNQTPAGGAGPAAAPTATTTSTPSAARSQVPVYVIGTQGGQRWLFREYRNAYSTSLDDRVGEAVTDAVNQRPLNADYDEPLFKGSPNSRATAAVTPTGITVTLPAAMVSRTGVTTARARLALAQLVWTATATAKAGPEVPVQFVVDKGEQFLFGVVPLDRPYTRSEFTPNPCAPLWITSLVEGTDVGHKPFDISGDAVTGQGGTVTWVLTRDRTEIGHGEATVQEAAPGATRHTWSFTPPTEGKRGEYELVVTLRPGPGSGLSTAATWQDTRTFLIR